MTGVIGQRGGYAAGVETMKNYRRKLTNAERVIEYRERMRLAGCKQKAVMLGPVALYKLAREMEARGENATETINRLLCRLHHPLPGRRP